MIKEQAIKGIKWSSVSSLVSNLLQLLQLIIVSRFISATDYGLMALTLVITYFAQILGDMGISKALIYKQQVSSTVFSGIFWASLFFCWFVFVLLFFLSPVLAAFFKQPLLATVVRVFSFSFIFLPLQMQYLALLRKELCFNKIALGEIASKLVALVIAVVFAVRGFGVFSLLYSTMAAMAVSTLLFFYWGRRLASIVFHLRWTEIREYLHFGIYQTGNEMLNYINFQIDTVIIGKMLGIDALGFYSFAKNLAFKSNQVLNPVITQVFFPLMAKVNTNKAALRNMYLKVVNYLSSAEFLVYPFIAALSDTVIRLFFSARWLPAAAALQALSLFCMIRSVFNPVGILLSAQGMVKRLFYWNLAFIFILPAVVFFSAAAGITAVAIMLSALLIVLILPMCNYLVFPACGAGFTDFWACIKRPLLNAVILFLALYAYNQVPISPLPLKFFSAVIIWILLCFMLTRYLNKEVYKETGELLRDQIGEIRKAFS